MKKSVMLGVNSRTNHCCKLSCLISFDNLIPTELETDDFIHDASGWGGQDEINRTLMFIKMKRTGKKLILDTPLEFRGADYDWGQRYPWRFVVDEIHELTKV